MRLLNTQGLNQNILNMNNPQNNYLNYKIVKCKNWDKDGTCKYGNQCTFAHGEEELRNKADNLYQFNPSMPIMMPMMVPQGMDMNQMQQLMANGQLSQLMMVNNMNPNLEHGQGNEFPNNDN